MNSDNGKRSDQVDRRGEDRPRRLPASATLVVWGSERLTLAEKTIWYHDWLMDYLEGPDGSYIGAKSMAARLGGSVTQRTVEQVRWKLGQFGLYFTFRRQGCREYGRVCTLPPTAVAKTNKAAPALYAVLDRYLALHEHTMGIEPGLQPEMNPTRPVSTSQVEPRSDSSLRGEGGKGGEAPLSSRSLSVRQLSSAVVVKENREVAHATGEEQRRPGETTMAWLERLAQRVPA